MSTARIGHPRGKRPTDRYPVRFDAHLVESAVLLSEHRLHPIQKVRFRRERNRCYEIDDPGERDRQFASLHLRWFGRMELGRPIDLALDAYSGVRERTARCLVLPVDREIDEHADLRNETGADDPMCAEGGAAPALRPTVFIHVRSALIADPCRFDRFLAHELLHVSDMLDPAFGYTTELPALEGGPARSNQIRDRYRVLWDCTIDGRLSRRGKAPDGVAERRLREFAAAFPEWGPDAEAAFRAWWEAPHPTHEDMMRAAIATLPAGSSRACPLCRFPYANLHPEPGLLPEALLDGIREEFPLWNADRGVCVPCVDLYRARLESPPSVRG